MVFTLKTKNNEQVVSVEVGLEHLPERNPHIEIRSVVNIKLYSELLMEIEEKDRIIAFIETFSELANLRDWLWDEFFAMRNNCEKFLDEVVKHIKNLLTGASAEFDLIATT